MHEEMKMEIEELHKKLTSFKVVSTVWRRILFTSKGGQ